jgi:hypothetical protein
MTYRMSTTHWLSAFVPVAGLLTACSGASGPVRTETRTVETFHAIELRGAAEAEVTVGKGPSLSITADDASLKDLAAEVHDGTLVISTHRRSGWFERRANVKLQIETAALDSLVLNGAGDFKVRDAAGDKLTLVMAGAGNLSAAGRVSTLNARIDGAGSLDLKHLAAVDADVSVNGAGSLSVCASGNLNATVNGVGSIDYSCNPQKAATSVHGVGSISPAAGSKAP